MDLSSHLKRTTETDKINEANLCKTPFLRQQKMTADRWGKNEVSLNIARVYHPGKVSRPKAQGGKIQEATHGLQVGEAELRAQEDHVH